MEVTFWDEHYKGFETTSPSTFAEYCCSNIVLKTDTIVEIGCGNGRDGVLLAQSCFRYTGIDQSEEALLVFQNRLYEFGLLGENLILQKADVTKIQLSSLIPDQGGRLVFYLRFSLHSVGESFENELLEFISELPTSCVLLVEARTVFDPLFGLGNMISDTEYVTDHYRRFLRPDIFLAKVTNSFNIEYFELAKGRAVFQSEDPLVLRCHLTNKI